GPVAPAPRRGIDAEEHRDGRLLDPDRRQRHRLLAIGDGVADADLLDPSDRDDVAGAGARDLAALEAVPGVQQRELAVGTRAVDAAERVLPAGGELARHDAADH